MNRIKKIFTLIVLISFILPLFPSNITFAYTYGAITDGRFEYNIYTDGTASIENYLGNEKIVTIPYTVNHEGNIYTVEEISESSFYNKPTIEEVYIYGNIKRISDSAFQDSEQLKKVDIAYGVSEMGEYVFSGCSNLTTAILPDSITVIPPGTFSGATRLNSIYLPQSIVSIGASAFEENLSLTDIKFPKGLYEIGRFAFQNAKSLKNIQLPDSLLNIGGYAFSGNIELQSIFIPDSVQTISEGAFRDCIKLTEVRFPSNLGRIEMDTFKGCSSITRIEIPKSVTFIDGGVFESCQSLIDIELPPNIKTIGTNTFRGCFSLRSLEIPNGVTSIQSWAFSFNASLEQMLIPKSVSLIEDYAFWDTSGYTIYGEPGSYAEQYFSDRFKPSGDYTPIIDWEADYALKLSDEFTKAPLGVADINFYDSQGNLIQTTKSTSDGSAKTKLPQNAVAKITVNKNGQVVGEKTNVVLNPKIQNNIISQIPENIITENSFKDLSLGKDRLIGPSIRVLNQNIELFNQEIEVKIPMGKGSGIKIVSSAAEKKIKAIIGYQVKAGNYSKEEEDKMALEEFNKIKDYYRKNKNNFNLNTLRSSGLLSQKATGSLLFNTNFDIKGYAEFSYNSGNVKLVEGGILLQASGGTSQKIPLHALITMKLSLNVDFKGNLILSARSGNYGATGDLRLTIVPTIAAELGKSYANLEVGVKGTFDSTLLVDSTKNMSLSNTLNVKANMELYLAGNLLKYELFKLKSNFKGTQIYPRISTSALLDISVDSLEEFKLIDRSYLSQRESENIEVLYSTAGLEVPISYPYSTPELISLGSDKYMILWIEDDGLTQEAITALYYVVYDGTEWSSPNKVNDTIYDNFEPKAVVSNGKVYVIWQQLTTNITGSLNEVLPHTDLYLSEYDGSAFKEPVVLTAEENGVYEFMHKIAVDQDKITVTWVENSENDPFQLTGVSSLVISTYENGSWNLSKKAMAENLYISEVLPIYNNDNLKIYYTTIDHNTNDSMKIQSYSIDAMNVIDEGNTISGISKNGNFLYYIKDSVLMEYSINTGTSRIYHEFVPQNSKLIMGVQTKSILYSASNGYANELYYSTEITTGNWSNPVIITDGTKFIRDYAAVVKPNNTIALVMNRVEVDQDALEGTNPYGLASIIYEENLIRRDIVVDQQLYYDNNQSKPGGIVTFSVRAENQSTQEISSFKLELFNENNELLKSESYQEYFDPGEVKILTISYALPSTFEGELYKAIVSSEELLEDNVDNNSAQATIGSANLVVNASFNTTSTVKEIKGSVENNGLLTAMNVLVNIYEGGENGNLIETIELGNIDKGTYKEFTVRIPETYLIFEHEANGKEFFIESIATESISTGEKSIGFVTLSPVRVTGLDVNKPNINMVLGSEATIEHSIFPTNASNKNIIYINENQDIVQVSETGSLLALKPGVAKIKLITSDGGFIEEVSIFVEDNKMMEIHIRSLPVKTKYSSGEELDLTGLQLEVIFKDGTREDIDINHVLVSGFNNQINAKHQVMLTYEGLSTIFTVEVSEKSLSSISISKPPTKTIYLVGEILDLSGIQVTGNYDDGSSEILIISDENVSGFDNSTSKAGQIVTVTVDGKTATFTVDIITKSLLNVTLVNYPTKLTYLVGEDIDLTGLVLLGEYGDGSKSNIAIEEIQVTGFDSTKAVEGQIVTLSVLMWKFEIKVDVVGSIVETVEVIAGPNRYRTAVAISNASYEQSDTVILVQSNNFPDALAAGPLAFMMNAPILLTSTASLSSSVKEEMKRLEVKKIIIMGGYSAVSANVEQTLKAEGYIVERLEGSNRYSTAVGTAKYMEGKLGIRYTIVMASGNQFADALAAGSYAAKEGYPILLTDGNRLTNATMDYITESGVKNIILVGGTSVISETLESQLKAMGISITRKSGKNRFDTSIEIARSYFGDSKTAVVANGMEFADALAAAPYAAKMNAPIILVNQTRINLPIKEYLPTSMINRIVVIGGDAAVNEDVRNELKELIK